MKTGHAMLIRVLVHILIAAPVFASGYHLLDTVPASLAAVGQLIYGLGCIVLGAIIVAFPVAKLVAQPTGRLFYPVIHDDRPKPNYSMVEAKVKQGLYEEAISAYEAIAAEHPGEIKPHIGMLEVALVHLKDPVRASELYNRAVETLQSKPDKSIVWQRYRQFASLLEAERERHTARTVHFPRKSEKT